MKKQILRFLSPLLTILGLFTILLALSSSSEGFEGCCGKKDETITIHTEFNFFNKDSLPIIIKINYFGGHTIQPQESCCFQDEINSYPEDAGRHAIQFSAHRDDQTLDIVEFKTTSAKCQKLPILVVWDGTHLKVAQ